jgi:VanZ family protein
MQLRNWYTPRALRILLVVYWCTLFVLTHLPKMGALSPAARHDKIGHAAAFALLGLLLGAAWQKSAGKLAPVQLLAAWLSVVLYAALDEWTQSFVGRTASFADWVADALGALVGLVLVAWLRGTRYPPLDQ